MLSLLFKTRLRYYRNYLRHHFDRAARIEIALIILIVLLLTGRSPADIGYSLKFLSAVEFPTRWANLLTVLLPLFYLAAEVLAFITLRPTGEGQILGALPFDRRTIANYHLLRFWGKTGPMLFLGTAPFLLGVGDTAGRMLHFFTVLGILVTLQLVAFLQAHRARQRSPQKLFGWLFAEAVTIFILIAGASWWRQMFIAPEGIGLIGFLLGWSAVPFFLFYIYRAYEPGLIETRVTRGAKVVFGGLNSGRSAGTTNALILRDLRFLWRRKRSTFILLLFALAIMTVVSFVHENLREACVSSIVLEIIFSALSINTLLILFEHDIKTVGLIRSLPINARMPWRARWLLAAGFLVLPMLAPVFTLPFKFGVGMEFLFFIVIIIGLAAVFAALYCNAGFGLFPHARFCSFLLNISLLLMILFWFFMPLGTILLPAIMLFWIRKSQRHFQFLEITHRG
ncbi:MAG: hypothetical protein ONB44_06585 [candidate division KSB1 bacterium]|nr:hypothetical protein [candidate division KSB1 bacterium]MDZ7301790.1 hypothetical protein [candidate division KSB1 bacterium]MDZ7311431.1 hypothetical protein [candidate division KSB1 bacterium]